MSVISMCQMESVSFSRYKVIENHPADSRIKICEDGIFQTLSSRMGTGGNNVPMVMENKYARTQNQVLCLLQKTYGEEKVLKWGIAIMAALQQADVLQQRMHEESIQSKAQNGEELDGGSLPRPSVVAEWVLRDVRRQQECGRSSSRRESTEQQFGESATIMPEMPHEITSSTQDMFNMWEKGEGIWLLRKALSEIQKIWESFNGVWEGGDGMNSVRSVVRRLTPL